MGKVITFPSKSLSTKELIKLKRASDQLDDVIRHSIAEESIPTLEMVGLLAHRLGALLANLDNKEKLWEVCEQVIIEKAFPSETK